MREGSDDEVFDFEKERALAASYGVTLLPPLIWTQVAACPRCCGEHFKEAR